MSVAARQEAPVLSYEDYLAEGEVMARYDIIDGVREPMTNPTRKHQRLLLRLARLFEAYEHESGRGQVLIAPCDILITRIPLRTRQPDVLFISNERLAQNPPDTDPAPLLAAPELVVEILSPNERCRARAEKIVDYDAVGVLDSWVVHASDETLEVLELAAGGVSNATRYRRDEVARSIAFPELVVAVSDLFAA
ncbi:MAG: Uma2 family endonuclease [Actinomycetota bacterium]